MLRSPSFGAFSAPRQRCQAGNVAAPELRFPVGYAMLEECPFRTEDEEASTHVAERWPCLTGGGEQEWGRFSGGLLGERMFGSELYGSV